jgi:hypothetical protein
MVFWLGAGVVKSVLAEAGDLKGDLGRRNQRCVIGGGR